MPSSPILRTYRPKRSWPAPPLRRPRQQVARSVTAHWRLLVGLALIALVEVWLHVRSFSIARPAHNLDAPFYTGCQNPVLNGSTRASAALVMLARNSDVAGAVQSVRSVQRQFNRHFGYPWVFLNDERWSDEFMERVWEAIDEDNGAGAKAAFNTIPKDMWGYPDWIDRGKAKHEMKSMEEQGISYAGKESYHHMCRFNSGYVSVAPRQRREADAGL